MAAKNKTLSRAGTAIFLVLIVGLAVYAGQKYQAVSSPAPTESATTPAIVDSTSPSSTPTASSTTSATSLDSYNLVTFATLQGANVLQTIDSKTKKTTTLFTDKDEASKIKQVGNITAAGDRALILMGDPNDDFGGSLWSVNLDGSGKKTQLIANFSSPWPPMFSPDGKKIAYVSFSNAEKDGGYMLEVAASDGTNPKELVRESSPITQPIWNAKGDQIAYLRQQDTTTSAIMTISATGGTPKTLATFANRVPYDLAWSSDDQLAFVDGTGDQAQLYEITTTQTDAAVLTTPTGRESRPVYAPSGLGLAFVLTNGSTSTAYIYDRTAQKFSSLGVAKIVLGWIRRQS